jgi:hypothetical protein
MLYGLVGGYQCVRGTYCLHLQSGSGSKWGYELFIPILTRIFTEDGGDMFLQNVDNHFQDYMESQHFTAVRISYVRLIILFNLLQGS